MLLRIHMPLTGNACGLIDSSSQGPQEAARTYALAGLLLPGEAGVDPLQAGVWSLHIERKTLAG